MSLRAAGRTTSAAASTLAGDMLDELDKAAKDLHSLEARTPGERRTLDDAIGAVTAAQLAVLRARDTLAHDGAGPALEGTLAELRASASGLEGLGPAAGKASP